MESLETRLEQIRAELKIRTKGPLSLALVLTRRARDEGLPFTDAMLRTDGGGQVKGLGLQATQAVLKDHGIDRVLAREGGRTSRGGLELAKAYAAALNRLHDDGLADCVAIEAWWIARVQAYFAASPFKLDRIERRSMRAVIAEVIEQARKRERELGGGTTITGTVLQHLVGAKLELLSPGATVHHGANVADEQSGRSGDFLRGRTAIHVSTMPSDALLRRCRDNVGAGLHPVIVTIDSQIDFAEELARRADIADAIDILGATAFLGANLLEWSNFRSDGSSADIRRFFTCYNRLIESYETDHSLNRPLKNPPLDAV